MQVLGDCKMQHKNVARSFRPRLVQKVARFYNSSLRRPGDSLHFATTTVAADATAPVPAPAAVFALLLQLLTDGRVAPRWCVL